LTQGQLKDASSASLELTHRIDRRSGAKQVSAFRVETVHLWEVSCFTARQIRSADG
jgi:hypothetical protein